MPRVVPSGLQSHLSSGATTLCWCYKVVRRDGNVMGFTDHDRALVFDSVTFEALSGFTGSEIHESLGLNVDNLDVQGAISSDRIQEEDILSGLYDDAQITVYRVNWADTSQRVLIKAGSLGELTRSDAYFRAEVRGMAHYLQQPQGRLYQYSCDADLGDDRCGVNIASYTASGTVSAVLDTRLFQCTGTVAAQVTDFFSRGKLTWTSGPNVGRAIEIKSHALASGVCSIEVWQEPVDALGVGHTFSLTAGCDKQPKTCRDRFTNFVNYRGFCYMPGNDYTTSYVNRDDTNQDGGSRGSPFA